MKHVDRTTALTPAFCPRHYCSTDNSRVVLGARPSILTCTGVLMARVMLRAQPTRVLPHTSCAVMDCVLSRVPLIGMDALYTFLIWYISLSMSFSCM